MRKVFVFLFLIAIANAVPSSVPAGEPMAAMTIRAAETKDFGRLILSFTNFVPVATSVSRGVVVITFERPVDVSVDHIANDLPMWIAAARLDPDHKALRLGLTRPARPVLTEAGHDVYLDLLPETWKGPLPGLPADVIQELSRKARLADQSKAINLAPQNLLVDTANSAKLSRLIFRGASPSTVRVNRNDQMVHLEFLGEFKIDLVRLRSELPAGFTSVDVDVRDGKTFVHVQVRNGMTPDARVEDGAAIIDSLAQRSGSLDNSRVGFSTIASNVSYQRDLPETPASIKNLPTGFSLTFKSGAEGLRLNVIAPSSMPIAAFSRATSAYIAFESDSDPDIKSLNESAKGVAHIRTFRSGRLFVFCLDQEQSVTPVIEGRTETGFNVAFMAGPYRSATLIDIMPQIHEKGRAELIALISGASGVHGVDDALFNDRLIIVPTTTTDLGVFGNRDFQELSILSSTQGFALVPFIDDLDLNLDHERLMIGRPTGLALAEASDTETLLADHAGLSVINRARWERDEKSDFILRRNSLFAKLATVSESERLPERLGLARFFAAHQLYHEAAALYQSALQSSGIEQPTPRDQLELAMYQALAGQYDLAQKKLSDPALADQDEAQLWRAYLNSVDGHHDEAIKHFRQSSSIVALYPERLRKIIKSQLADSALFNQSIGLATQLIDSLLESSSPRVSDRTILLRARLFEVTGRAQEALPLYDRLSQSKEAAVEIKARHYKLALDLKNGVITPDEAVKTYQQLSMIWRGDSFEGEQLVQLVKAAIAAKDWRSAFTAAKRLNRAYPELDGVRPLLEDMAIRFDALLAHEGKENIDAFEAVALFLDFRDFMPIGRRGDQLTSKLIERLVTLDLIPQATDLLKYQINNRLSVMQKPVAAIELAELYLRDKKPIDAVRAIADTRGSGLDEGSRKARRLIEARARAELGETKAAIDILEGLDDQESLALRGDIFWMSRNYQKAGESYEVSLGESWRQSGTLDSNEAAFLLRAAISFVLADDQFGIDRLKARYYQRLEKTPDAPAIRLLTSPLSSRAAVAASLASTMAQSQLLDSFLRSYRARYIEKKDVSGSEASQDRAQPGGTNSAG